MSPVSLLKSLRMANMIKYLPLSVRANESIKSAKQRDRHSYCGVIQVILNDCYCVIQVITNDEHKGSVYLKCIYAVSYNSEWYMTLLLPVTCNHKHC